MMAGGANCPSHVWRWMNDWCRWMGGGNLLFCIMRINESNVLHKISPVKSGLLDTTLPPKES